MILVYGTACLDRLRTIPHLPVGGYVGVESETWLLGGEAANTAFALKTWGANFRFAGNHLGAGVSDWEPTPEHELLWELLRAKGLAFDGDRPRGETPPVCDIYLTPDGERTMFGVGFDTMSSGMSFDLALLDGVDWFCMDMNFGEFGRSCVRQVSERGVRCYLMDFVDPLDPLPDGCFWQSSTDWAGVKGDAAVNLAFVEEMAGRGVTALLTDGGFGCFYATPGAAGRHLVPLVSPVVVDGTGAGDTFRAGMLFGLDRGWELERCVSFASVAASLKCEYRGATTRQASLSEIELFL